MPHTSPQGRKSTAFAPLISLTVALLALSLGLAACGGSSSTTTQTTANAAARGTPGSATTAPGGTSSTGATPGGTSSTGAPPSGTSSTGAPPAGQPNPAHFAAVRECLSKKGITLPRRTPGAAGLLGGGASGAQLPKGMSRTQFAEALKSCGGGFGGNHFRRVGGFHNPLNNPRFHQVLARFAACLRQQGVNVGEPNTSGKGPIFDTRGINTGSPQFRAATAKCRSALLGIMGSRAHPGAAASGSAAGASS
jgi:hypothetical protein